MTDTATTHPQNPILPGDYVLCADVPEELREDVEAAFALAAGGHEGEAGKYWNSKKPRWSFGLHPSVFIPFFGFSDSPYGSGRRLSVEYVLGRPISDTYTNNHTTNHKTADDYLLQAMEEMADRAASRDTGAERSMAAAVEAFNAIYGHGLSETEGWQFMSLLKKSRGAGGSYREDDYTDDVAYAALAAESAGKT